MSVTENYTPIEVSSAEGSIRIRPSWAFGSSVLNLVITGTDVDGMVFSPANNTMTAALGTDGTGLFLDIARPDGAVEGAVIYLVGRRMPLAQDYDPAEMVSLQPAALGAALDLLAMCLQDLQPAAEQAAALALRIRSVNGTLYVRSTTTPTLWHPVTVTTRAGNTGADLALGVGITL